MERIKSALGGKREGEQETTGNSGKITGEGSHFGGAKDSAGYSLGGPESATTMDSSRQGELGSSMPGQQSSTTGSSMPQSMSNPEGTGVSHVGTADSSQIGSGDAGSAAVGSTSTYSSHHLTKGDPTPGVIDHQSQDPATFQTPERSGATGATGAGVPSGAATTAASTAFNNGREREGMPGGFPTPGYENPYKAHNLDPRVDGLPSRPKDTSSSAGTGMATTAAGVATAGGGDRSREPAAPSSLTSHTSPADRSTELGRAENTNMPESSVGTGTTGTESTQKPGMMGKMLGAVGLGSMAGGAAASEARSGDDSASGALTGVDHVHSGSNLDEHVYGSRREETDIAKEGRGTDPIAQAARGEQSGQTGYNDSAIADTPEQPTTTTGVSSYTAPTESTPQHYRKESIPTTAYPGGDRSPSATAPPVGGTQASAYEQPRESHTGRDAALGGVAAGGVAGTAAAIGHHEQQSEVRATPETASYQPQSSTYTSSAPTTTAPVGSQAQSSAGTGGLSYDAVTAPSQAETSTPVAAQQDHTGRNAALAGATGVGAGGAGAYGVHEVEQHRAQEEADKHQKAVEKEEQKQQKEMEKEQKQHEKEVEKQQKEHSKAVAAAEKEQQKLDDDERKRREKEAAVGTGVGAGPGAAAYEGEKHHGEEEEKKPSLFKRLFKRSRKNKHTGEDEEYDSENEDDSHKTPVSAGVGATSAGGATATALQNDPNHEPTKYEEVSGGAVKPSYNPFKHDDPKNAGQTASNTSANAAIGGEHGRTGAHVPHSSATDDLAREGYSTSTPATTGTATQAGGLAQDSTPRDHMTHEDVTSKGHHGHHTATPATTTGSAQSRGLDHDNRPHESITGMPYDPSKDPETAARLASQQHNSVMQRSSGGYS